MVQLKETLLAKSEVLLLDVLFGFLGLDIVSFYGELKQNCPYAAVLQRWIIYHYRRHGDIIHVTYLSFNFML